MQQIRHKRYQRKNITVMAEPQTTTRTNNPNPATEEDQLEDPLLIDSKDRLGYAKFLNKSQTFPFLTFLQDQNDGFFRCVTPKPPIVQLVNVIRPATAPAFHTKFLKPRKFVSKLEEDLEARIDHYRNPNGKQQLLESLIVYKKEQEAKKQKFIENSGRYFIQEVSERNCYRHNGYIHY